MVTTISQPNFRTKSSDSCLEQQEQICQIRVPTYLSGTEAGSLTTALQHACQDSTEFSQIALDFSQTQFMDCRGLSALARGYKLATELDLPVVLSHVTPQVMLVLSTAGLDRFFTIKGVA